MSCPTTAQAANKRLPAGSPKKTPPLFSGGVFYDRVCKPGSVIDSHLSRRTVAGALQPPSRKQPGRPCFLCGVAPDRVYSNGRFHTPLGALLPHLSTFSRSTLPFPVCTFCLHHAGGAGVSGETVCALAANPERQSAQVVYFCCTFPQIALGGRYPLSLPCGARTFLMRGLSALRPRLSDPVAEVLYFICRKKSNGLQFLSRADIIQAGNFKRGFWI